MHRRNNSVLFTYFNFFVNIPIPMRLTNYLQSVFNFCMWISNSARGSPT